MGASMTTLREAAQMVLDEWGSAPDTALVYSMAKLRIALAEDAEPVKQLGPRVETIDKETYWGLAKVLSSTTAELTASMEREQAVARQVTRSENKLKEIENYYLLYKDDDMDAEKALQRISEVIYETDYLFSRGQA